MTTDPRVTAHRPDSAAPHPGTELVARLRAEAVPVSGARAFGVGLDFLRDPILAVARCHERWGPAVELSMSGPGRRAWRTLLLGPQYNREILSRPDCARPAGLWNGSGPPGSAQAAMRGNYLATVGAEHAQLVRAVVPTLTRDRTLGYFDAVRNGVLVTRTMGFINGLGQVDVERIGQPIPTYRRLRNPAQTTR